MINSLTTVVSDTARLVALFDALADAPRLLGAVIQLHDADGSLIKTLRLWAADRGLELQRTTLTLDHDLARDGGVYTWDQVRFRAPNGVEIVVHDNTSKRYVVDAKRADEVADDVWSPAQTEQVAS